MSLWGEYAKEVFNFDTLEFDGGFITYGISGDTASVEFIFVSKTHRKSMLASTMLKQVELIAKEAGRSKLIAQVLMTHPEKERAVRANLASGFNILSANAGCILFVKDIGG